MAGDSHQARNVANSAYAVLQARWVDGPSDVLDITRSRLRIGRQPGNDIVVDSPAISGDHLELEFSQGRASACDLGSRNGTSLGGRRLPSGQPIPLPPGAVLRLGNVLDLIVMPPDESRPSLPTPRQLRLVSQPQPGLVIAVANAPSQRVLLPQRAVKIGRRPENDIVIDHPAVSGMHAEIVPHAAGQFHIVALDSLNGLQVHGQAVKSKPLRPGEGIHITNDVRIEFRPAMCFLAPFQAAEKAVQSETRFFDARAQKTIRIGRAQDNDYRVDDSRVSRYHAVLERVGARYRIRDLRSDNGTFVNGKRVEREQFIQEGDVIHVANVKLRFAEDGLTQTDAGGLRLDLLGLRKVVDARAGGGKNLLQDISLSIYPREFVALVGTSGAGKSTLLDAMNGFRPATQGHILVNGVGLYDHFDAYRTEMGYVPQDDIMHRELTVEEALDYAAKLRMPGDTSPQERARRVAQVLRDLDLEGRRKQSIQTLSGGQRKRVSIGIELITQPRLFFLDEATSGLDPGTEKDLMKLLRQLAEDPHEGRTIVLITHATKNVMLCDQVIFLTKGGYLAFFGPPDKALQYFEQYRSPEARRLEPDFEFDDIYDLLDPDKALPPNAGEKEKLALAAEWAERYRRSPYYQQYVVQRLQTAQQPRNAQGQRVGGQRKRPRASALRQFAILVQRHWAVMKRDRKGLAILLLQAPLIGLSSLATMGGGTFSRVDGSPSDALTTLFLAVIIVLLFGTVNAAREFTKEIAVYKRERMVNLKIGPYVFSKVFVALLFCLYQVAVYLMFTLVSTDWPTMNFVEWSSLYFTLSLTSLSGVMLGLLLSALSSNDGQAVALIPVILIPQFIFAGVLMPDLGKVPVIPYIATSRWATTALATITHADQAGNDDPKVADEVDDRLKAELALKIVEESDKALADKLETTVQDEMGSQVVKQTDDVVAQQRKSAEAEAASQAYRGMVQQGSATGQPVPLAMADQQANQARQKARQAVDAKRSEISANVTDELEGPLRAEIKNRIREEVETEVRQKFEEEATRENPVVKQAYDYFGDVFHENVPRNWAAMSAILAVLLGVILVLQKRKDVI